MTTAQRVCAHCGGTGWLGKYEQCAWCDGTGKGSRAAELLRQLEPYLDSIVCYASTMSEHDGNRLAKEVRDYLATTREGVQLDKWQRMWAGLCGVRK